MDCVRCDHLMQVFTSRLEGYVQARAAAFYRVSTELAARKQVDMERAKTDFEEHRLACHRAPNLKDFQSLQLTGTAA
jgi:hypothetical protein